MERRGVNIRNFNMRTSLVFFVFCRFLAIFRNEMTTILTPSTSEGGEWGRWEWCRFPFWRSQVPDYESAMLIYLYIFI